MSVGDESTDLRCRHETEGSPPGPGVHPGEGPPGTWDRLAEIEALYNSALIGLCVFDRELRYVRINRRLAKINGVPAEDHIGRTVREILPDLADTAEQLAERVFKSGEPLTDIEIRGKTPARPGVERIWIEHWLPLRDRDGMTVGISVVTEEVTERRKIERDLLESEIRFRTTFENAAVGIAHVDLDGRFLRVNSRLCEITGYSRRELTARTFQEITHQGDLEANLAQVKRLLAGKADHYTTEKRYIRRDGSFFWANLTVSLQQDEEGKPSYFIAVVEDISRRKEAEGALRRLNEELEREVGRRTEELGRTVDQLQDEVIRRREAETRLRQRSRMLEGFFRHTITPLAFMDREFNFIRVNDAYAAADGRRPEDFISKNHFDLYPDPGIREIFDEVVRTKQPYQAFARPFTHPHAPERKVTFWNWQLTPILDEAGEVGHLVLNLENVTERQEATRKLEERAQQLQKLAIEVSRAEERERRRLAEILHDDLQQLLVATKFHLSILASRTAQQPDLRKVVKQVDALLDESVDRSRSLSHELSPPVLQQGRLGEALRWLARRNREKYGLLVEVEDRSEDSIPEPVRVFLYKVAQELLFNVVKHAGVEEARIRVARCRDETRLTVSDEGVGFEPDDRARESSESGGFGLLSIRERVEFLGGHMKIRSEPGRGSSFEVSVPDHSEWGGVGRDTTDQAKRAAGREESANGANAVSPERARIRVLLVDDHEVMRQGLATLLNDLEDVEVVGHAGDGQEAIERAQSLQPDVVIMDLAMPVMDGVMATQELKSRMPGLRIVGLSMFDEEEMGRQMLAAGAESFLSKAGPSDQLIAAIRRCGFRAERRR
jgi:PAS domain S-box-containing protein